MKFSWEQFFRHNRLSESSNKNLWMERISACGHGSNKLWALRFMALVHFFLNGANRMIVMVMPLAGYSRWFWGKPLNLKGSTVMRN